MPRRLSKKADHMKKYLLFTLPVIMLASPAVAQTATQNAGAFRVEGLVVYDKIKADFGSDPDQFNPARDRDFDVSYGVGIGYDFVNVGGIAVGVDAEVTESSAKRSVLLNGTEVGELNFGNDLYAGGRVTVPISGSFSAFGKVGYTSLRARFKPANSTIDRDDFLQHRLSGVRGAVGVQYGTGEDQTYYGVQYRYSNYQDDVLRHQVGLFVGARF